MTDHSDRVGCRCQQEPQSAAPTGGSSRRTLIQLTAGVLFTPTFCVAKSATLCCYTADFAPSAVSVAGTEIYIDLKQAKSLRSKGAALKLVDEARGIDVLVVHDQRGQYRAFSRRCTHGPGSIAYNPGKETIQCTCWGHSEYGFDGTVIGGPAKRPLPVYTARVDGDRLVITLPGDRQ